MTLLKINKKKQHTVETLTLAGFEQTRVIASQTLFVRNPGYTAAVTVRTREAFPQDWAATQNNLALAYRDRIRGNRANNIENAYKIFKSVIATIESLREEIVSGEESKRKQAEEWNHVYTSMVKVCLELRNIKKAIEYVERSKTRNLVEQILEHDSKTIFPTEIFAQLEKYRDEIATGQYQIQNGKTENPQELVQHLQQLRQQRNELQDRYLPVGSGFNLDSFQPTLDEHTAIIEWYIVDDQILAFIFAQKGEITVWQSQKEDLQALVNWTNQYLQNYYTQKHQWQINLGEELKTLASILHIDEILKQIPEHCDQLILIPHKFLHLFPLHALPIENQKSKVKTDHAYGEQKCEYSCCLLDVFPGGVSYAPSCQIIQQLQQRQRPDFQSLFAIQNPTEDLHCTDLEVEAILSYFPSHQLLSKKQATKAALSQAATQLKKVNYLHFSCHGSFNFDSPQNSFLLLANAYVSPIPSNVNPEIYLKLSDTEAIDLRKCLTLGNLFERTFDLSQTCLVVLSACETGLVDFNNTSDEYISLPSGFLYAGSRNVISSLWTVSDFSTAFLMIKFIQNLKAATVDDGDFSVAVELKKAQLWLRNATTAELQTWTNDLELSPEQAQEIYHNLDWFDANEKPFQDPVYWAAFCAIGQ